MSAAECSRLIDTILTIWQIDLDAGGLDISLAGPEAIARGASPQEQRAIGDWLRKSLKAATGRERVDAWQQRARIGSFFLLQGDAGLSDEELLTEYCNAELWDDAAYLLVQMGRVDEAITLAFRRLTVPNQLTVFADQLIAPAIRSASNRRSRRSMIDSGSMRPRIRVMMSSFVPGWSGGMPSMAARRSPSRWPVPDAMPHRPDRPTTQ